MADTKSDLALGVKYSPQVSTDVFNGDLELAEGPLAFTMDTRTTYVTLPDDRSEHIVTAINWSASGSGEFYLHSGDGIAISNTFHFSGNSGDDTEVHLSMGMGGRICASVKITGGSISLQAKYYTHRTGMGQHGTAYEVA